MKKKILIVLAVVSIISFELSAQSIVVTDDNTYTTGQASSVLDVKSTSKGFLAPRMTMAQRIAIGSPADGLLVYQTNGAKGFYYYNASAWTLIDAGGVSQWINSGDTISYSNGYVGVGLSNPTSPLSVKDVLEVRRVGSLSQILFSNTSGTGDFRISGDGGDVFWQGGGARNLQMGSYWGIIFAGDRQLPTIPAFSAGVANTNVLALAQRDGSIPLAVQGNSASQSANLMEWRSSAATLNVVDRVGKMGLGITSPTAILHLKAGTATPATAPLKFETGTNLTTPENGVMEYDGTNYYVTSGAVRYTMAKTLTATATINFAATAGMNSRDVTITVNGASDGDAVVLGVPNVAASANSAYTAFVSAANTVTIRFNNYTLGAIDPANGTFRVSVLKY